MINLLIFLIFLTNDRYNNLRPQNHFLRVKCYEFIIVRMVFVNNDLQSGPIYFPRSFSIFTQWHQYTTTTISVFSTKTSLYVLIFANTQSSLAKWFASFLCKPFRTFFGSSHLVPYLFPMWAGLHLYFLSSHWTICFPLFIIMLV